jgi:hypothetical protein|tara:strand:+ start:1359 stop:2582 length:1224 start_codon:yes stop_codon:yes gene_type:complete
MNDEYHSVLSSPCLVYFKTENSKGYMFPINHSEAFKLPFDKVMKWIDSKYDRIYTLNKKEVLYYFDNNKLVDISYDRDSDFQHYTKFRDRMYSHFSHLEFTNSLVPISKHYETEEKTYEDIKSSFLQNPNIFYNETLPKVFKAIEEQGIKIHPDYFHKHFKYNEKSWFLNGETVYTKYNLYNLTTRPTNSFNGVNFAALNKNDGSRTAFIPKNDLFFEFDYDSYHVRILAKLINYELDKDSVHTQLGKMYFGKDTLTDTEYKQSKEQTFKQLYGGVFDQYKEIPFFKLMTEYVNKLWKKFNAENKLELIGGKVLAKEQILNPTPNKILNYIIQSAETYNNVISVRKVIEYLEERQSKVILYTYDSFLIDYSISDGKHTLQKIKQLLESEGYVIKASYGNNYNSLKNI